MIGQTGDPLQTTRGIRIWDSRAWPVWLNLMGQLFWIAGAVLVSPFLYLGFPSEVQAALVFHIVVVGTIITVLPGISLGLRSRKIRMVFAHLVLFLVLLPLVFYSCYSGLVFSILVSILALVFMALSGLQLDEFDEIISSNFSETYRACYPGFLASDFMALIVATILFALVWPYFALPDLVREVYLEPEEPLAGEDFDVVVRMSHEVDDWSNWNGSFILKYRLNRGEEITESMSRSSDIRFRFTVPGQPRGTVFSYRVAWYEGSDVCGWREVVVG